MDILTQGLLGGVLAQSVASKEEKKIATITGVAAGLLADADILISSSSDPMLNIEYHRHFSHSLFFIPFGAFIAMLLLWPILRRHLSIQRLYVFCLMGYSMSGVLDACTSYGTHLLWPLSDDRIALNIISIIDPVFTLTLLTALCLGLWIKSRKIAVTGLILCLSYLSFGFFQQHRAEDVATQLIAKRGHTAIQHVVKPTLGNLVLWRSVYATEQDIYVNAVRVGLFTDDQVIKGESLQRFSMENDLPELDRASTLYGDIQRFMRFSNNYVAFDPSQENVIGDIRYSMLPISANPLWGLVIDLQNPDKHADYRFFRKNDKETRQAYLDLLLGRTIKERIE
ncbi:MAG: metal-dependent hydrolase [Gammaproteobacteria bacterium]|jgi:inner membrane protein|nr:metal-dependent hydrolase [Gammaproteobacteria bacterium]